MWRVRSADATDLKLYRLGHGQSVAQMSRLVELLRENGVRVPRIYEVDQVHGWVVAEWIPGRSLSGSEVSISELARRIGTLQASVNELWGECPFSSRPFSYFHHFALPRYLYWTGRRFGRDVGTRNGQIATALLERWPEPASSDTLLITNPDFSLQNLVEQESGVLAIIDTELLGVDRSAGFELANFQSRIGREPEAFIESYISAYSRVRSMDEYLASRPFWDACVAIKRVGKQAMFLGVHDASLLKQIDAIEEAIC